MKVNFIKTYDVMNFNEMRLGDVFLDAEDENNKCVYIKIDRADCVDNAYNLTENIKVSFQVEKVYRLQSELNILSVEAI